MQVTQAVIIHTIQDADHYLEQQLLKDAELFSFNVQIVTYLKYRHNVICHNLCSYMDSEEVLDIQKTTLQATSELLAELDRQVAPALNRELGLSIRYFTPLYSYVGARQLSIYDIVVRCLRHMIDQYVPSFILVYEGTLGPLNQSINISFLNKLLPGVKFRTIQYKQPAESRKKTVISGISSGKIAPLLEKDDITNTKSDKKNVVVFEPAGKLQLNKVNIYELDSRKLLHYPIEYKISLQTFPVASALQSIHTTGEDRENILMLLYAIIIEAFCQNIIQHLRLLQTYRNIHNQSPIHNAYWDIPPYQGASALVLEYLMSNQFTQVTGVQSQGTFFVGQVKSPYIDVTVFNRCHQYLTQEAMLKDDLIVTKSKVTVPKLTKSRKKADIAIYLTPISSFTKNGQFLSITVQFQEALLTFLGKECKGNIHVVVYKKPSVENYAILDLIKDFNNMTLIQDATMDNYLNKYIPNAILMDSHMPFLEKILHEGIPVILMKDSMITFEDEVLISLKKRVYYTEELEEVKNLLQYFRGVTKKE
jgi:hypothetical protein